MVKKLQRFLGKLEDHPYGAFIPSGATSMIIGSFPIAKFTKKKRPKLEIGEMDFSYGSKKNNLWKLLAACFECELKTKEQVIKFLTEQKIALADVILRCRRYNDGSSDSDLTQCEFNLGLKEVIEKSSIRTLYFTSSKVQTLFHQKIGPIPKMKEVLLISPSASGLRRLSDVFVPIYKSWKMAHPHGEIAEFRVEMYKKIFKKKK